MMLLTGSASTSILGSNIAAANISLTNIHKLLQYSNQPDK